MRRWSNSASRASSMNTYSGPPPAASRVASVSFFTPGLCGCGDVPRPARGANVGALDRGDAGVQPCNIGAVFSKRRCRSSVLLAAQPIIPAMKYFTAELYQRFNSFDVDEAERADEAWDKAEAAYKERLARIREHMPSQVVKLSELCLHDALVVSRVEQAEPAGAFDFFDATHPGPLPFVWTAVAIIAVTLDEEVISLIYALSDHIHTREAPQGWRFSKIQEQWLYDEVDLMDDHRGPFIHRIMLSTGITLEIPFVSVIIHRFTVPAVTKLAKQMA